MQRKKIAVADFNVFGVIVVILNDMMRKNIFSAKTKLLILMLLM